MTPAPRQRTRRRPPLLLVALAVVFTVIGVLQVGRATGTGEVVPIVAGALQIACGLALTFLYVRDVRGVRRGAGTGDEETP